MADRLLKPDDTMVAGIFFRDNIVIHLNECSNTVYEDPKLNRMKDIAKAKPAPTRGGESKRVYDGLKSSILTLELVPGVSVDESHIALKYGVSRTPIREALVRLQSEGLVIMLPNRGAHIAPLDLGRIRDYLEGIDLIQRAVLKWAAFRCTPNQLPAIRESADRFERAAAKGINAEMVLANHDFHAAIASVCGNGLIADAYGRFLDEGLRVSRFTLNSRYFTNSDDSQAFVDLVVLEHNEMVHALESHDVELAEKVASAHTRHTQERFAAYLQDSLSPLVKVDPLQVGMVGLM
jgi:DNA-binding GntR family transcriptional regulator